MRILALIVHLMVWPVLFGIGLIAIAMFPALTERFGPELIFPWAGISFLLSFPVSYLVVKKGVVMWRRSPVTGATKPDEPLP